jgi:hypothetical protein
MRICAGTGFMSGAFPPLNFAKSAAYVRMTRWGAACGAAGVLAVGCEISKVDSSDVALPSMYDSLSF